MLWKHGIAGLKYLLSLWLHQQCGLQACNNSKGWLDRFSISPGTWPSTAARRSHAGATKAGGGTVEGSSFQVDLLQPTPFGLLSRIHMLRIRSQEPPARLSSLTDGNEAQLCLQIRRELCKTSDWPRPLHRITISAHVFRHIGGFYTPVRILPFSVPRELPWVVLDSAVHVSVVETVPLSFVEKEEGKMEHVDNYKVGIINTCVMAPDSACASPCRCRGEENMLCKSAQKCASNLWAGLARGQMRIELTWIGGGGGLPWEPRLSCFNFFSGSVWLITQRVCYSCQVGACKSAL